MSACVLQTHPIPGDEYLFFLRADGTGWKCINNNFRVIGVAPGGAPGTQLMNMSSDGDGGIYLWPDTRSLVGVDALTSCARTLER